MAKPDLDRIETRVGVTLPADYREFALRLPTSPDDNDAYRCYPFMDVDEIISINQSFQSGDRVDGWQPALFCIGTFEGGDYFIDVTDLGKGVFLELSNCGGSEQGDYYKPEDYSSCRISSWDEFIK